MELFTIQCTTCRARLKVTDASAVGAILACPKCHSMVQVVPPVGWQGAASAAPPVGELASDPPATPNRSTAPSRPAAEHVASTTAVKPSVATPPALPQRPALRPSDSAAIAAAASALPIPARPAAEVQTPAAAQVAASVQPIPLPAAAGSTMWTLLVARARQEWLAWSAGLAAGVVLGAVVWLIVASRATPEPMVADARPPLVQDAAPSTKPSTTGAAAQIAPVAKPSLDEPTEFTQPAESADRAPEIAATDEPAGEPAVSAAPGTARSVAPPAEPAASEHAEPKIKLDPVLESPTGPQPPAVDQSEAAPPSAAADADPEAGDEPAKVPPAAKGARGSATPTRRVLSQSDVDERLGASLPQVEFVKVPLSQFVQFVAEFTTLPIVIDDASLKSLNLTRQTPVTVRLSDTTAGDALSAGLVKLGLAGELVDGKVMIRARKKAAE